MQIIKEAIVDDTFAVFEEQIEKLIDAVKRLKTEKKQLIEANQQLEEQVKNLRDEIERINREKDELAQSVQGTESAKEKLDSLLSRINEALSE
ncbi:hypothetical protein DRQ29_07155 [bacterium]|nr:MAG: hypothetical protein DRQ29_07155 [bacterium]